MSKTARSKAPAQAEVTSLTTAGPLVFISHDTRDAELADAFSKLLKSVSAGMIKTFVSSDKKGTEGIDFGDEWYKRLMTVLQSTSDVVCLFTERSLGRPWILFEAGVAKGKLGVPVVGIALGVPLSHVSAGPFYQFQNMDDSEADLTKLVNQLSRRVANLELDPDVVKQQVAAFKATEAAILQKLSAGFGKKAAEGETEASALTKLSEEMKALPSRLAERLVEDADPGRRGRVRRFHPVLFREMIELFGAVDDPFGIIVAASLLRDEVPWLYELALEAYRALSKRDGAEISHLIFRIQRLSKIEDRVLMFLEEQGPSGAGELRFILGEFTRILQHWLRRTLTSMKEAKAATLSRAAAATAGEKGTDS